MVKKFRLAEFSKPLNAITLMDGNQGLIASISIDSRKIYPDPEVLFVAIPGENTDGHLFLTAAYEQGVRNFVVLVG